MPQPPSIVVMGVSGSGKSTIGSLLATALGVPFIDADDLHSAAAKAKMAAGHPLTDEDRWPWLARVGDAIAGLDASVTACSALRRSYRDALRAAAPGILFIELDGSRQLLHDRLAGRHHEFMSPALLDSQLATLEPLQEDEAGLRVGIDATVGEVVETIVRGLTGLSGTIGN